MNQVPGETYISQLPSLNMNQVPVETYLSQLPYIAKNISSQCNLTAQTENSAG